MMNDMTKGSPLKLILHFTIPVLIGNLFQQFYNVVDSIIVGRFNGVDALAAVGSTGSLVFLVFGWIVGMASGFAILIAQSFGANDLKRLRNYTAVSTYLCVGMAVLLTALLLVGNEPLLRLMNTPDNIFDDASAYVSIVYAGLASTVAYNMLSSILRALGDSKAPLYFLVTSSIINIVLDLLFVGVLGMGVRGAGYATVISQVLASVLCYIYMKKKYQILKLTKEDMGISWTAVKNLLSMGVPMALQFSITAVGAMIVQSALNALGSIYIAAFSAAGKIQNIIAQPFVSLGVTMATFVGQNVGAGEYERIKKGVNICFKLSLGISVFAILATFFFGDFMVKAFVDDPTGLVTQAARQYFRIVIWFYPFLALIFLYRNALQGLGDGLFPMLGGVFELLARGITIMVLAGSLGFVGISMADPVAWVSALIPLIPVYYLRLRKNIARMKALENT